MSRGIPPDLINRAWEIYAEFTYGQNGAPRHNTDRMHWISGFSTALAVITGGMDLGIAEGTLSIDVINHLIQRELPAQQDALDRAMADVVANGVRLMPVAGRKLDS